ncbi:serine O-acetyltransferase [Clostridium butyricum]|uniref:serine O-acetyltransferase n=1 Tax=Clostridium butyricum TaxID=1492 RepID=UPI0003F5F49E|nr:serine acetyltransferase [Clostridium butyricum]
MNKKIIKEIWINLNWIRTIFILIGYFFITNKEILRLDIEENMIRRDGSNNNDSVLKKMNYLMACYPEFRNVFFYRMAKNNIILSKILEKIYMPQRNLYITADKIGTGLVVYHGFSTIIYAKQIGKNCTIYQQVTIGKTNDIPTIGDNVTICPGAIVIGGICIGNNSIIGAGSVITKDIPQNSVVVGNPAFIIRQNGEKVRIKL